MEQYNTGISRHVTEAPVFAFSFGQIKNCANSPSQSVSDPPHEQCGAAAAAIHGSNRHQTNHGSTASSSPPRLLNQSFLIADRRGRGGCEGMGGKDWMVHPFIRQVVGGGATVKRLQNRLHSNHLQGGR